MADVNTSTRKRKSAPDDVFEVSEGELSPEPSPTLQVTSAETDEPSAKLQKLDVNSQESDGADSGFLSQISDPNEDVIKIDEGSSPVIVLEENKSEENQNVQPPADSCENDGSAINGVEHIEDSEGIMTQKAPESCVISIRFKDENASARYKAEFIKFVKSFIELDTVESSDSLHLDVINDVTLNSDEWIIVDDDEIESIDTKKPGKKHKKKSKSKKDAFVVDTNPFVSNRDNGSTKYCSKFAVIENVEETQPEEVRVSFQTCFNCSANHSVRDCPLPKDYTKINAAKLRFKVQTKTTRYHADEDQMYAHISPGKISDNLRKALGLRKNELPPYIYRMRVLGYPPGWVDEAKVSHSELNMYDIKGRDVKTQAQLRRGIDAEKIVDYPGFNVPMGEGVWDDFRFYRVPPFSADYSKEAMLNYIAKIEEATKDNFETCSMDISMDADAEEPAPGTEDDKEKPTNSIDAASSEQCLSLTELELKKRELLAKLTDSVAKSDESNGTPPKSVSPDDTSETASSADTNVVKTSSFGTPILKAASGYSRLPQPDNFSKNVSPIINFENLPNATGKYEQMTGVLHKVRSALRNLHDRSQS